MTRLSIQTQGATMTLFLAPFEPAIGGQGLSRDAIRLWRRLAFGERARRQPQSRLPFTVS